MLANGKTRVFSFHLCHNFIPTLFAFWQKRHSSHFLGKNVSSFPMPRNSCYLWNHCFEAIAVYGMWQQGLGEAALLAEGRCNDNFILLRSLPSAACCFPWTFSVLPHAFLLSFSRCSSSFSFCGGIACSFRPGYTTLWYIYVEKLEWTGLNSHLRLIPLISLFGSIYQAHTHRAVFRAFHPPSTAERFSFKLALQWYWGYSTPLATESFNLLLTFHIMGL